MIKKPMVVSLAILASLIVLLAAVSFASAADPDVTTLAGSGLSGSTDDFGTAAEFNIPRGVAMDAAGNLFVADLGNNLIRKSDVASGLVSTVVGVGGVLGGLGALPLPLPGTDPLLVELSNPADVAVDQDGNLYIADLGTNRILRMDGVTGLVNTLVFPLLGPRDFGPRSTRRRGCGRVRQHSIYSRYGEQPNS